MTGHAPQRRRIERLEEIAGLNEPCVSCEAGRLSLAAIAAVLQVRGVHPKRPRARDLMALPCPICHAALTPIDVTTVPPADRAQIRRTHAALVAWWHGGPQPSDEVIATRARITDEQRPLDRAHYGGAVYDEAIAAADEALAAFFARPEVGARVARAQARAERLRAKG